MLIKIKLLKINLNLFIPYLPHLYVAEQHDKQREAVGQHEVGDVVTEKHVVLVTLCNWGTIFHFLWNSQTDQ